MQLTLQQVVDFLRENKYILASKGDYVLAKRFNEDVKKMRKGDPVATLVPKGYKDVVPSIQATGITVSPAIQCVASMVEVAKRNTQVDWIEWFTRLITDAKVPRTLEDNRNQAYAANKYSEDGMKAFRKAMETGVDYGTLVRSVMLYYKSGIRYKKAVGNYFAQGDWRTDYQNLYDAANLGTIELDKHIKQEVKTNEHNPYRLG